MENTKATKSGLLTETPWRAILFFSIPMIIGNLLQQLYTMVDAIVASHYVGEGALAVIGVSYALTNVFIALALGLNIGSAVVISQLYGQSDYAGTKIGINTLIINAVALGVVLGGFGLIACEWILSVLNTPAGIMIEANTYLSIYFWGLPFLFVYNAVSAVMNALGDSKTPLLLLLFSSVFNIVLAIILVQDRGVAGVAVATLIAQGTSAIAAYFILQIKMKDLSATKAPYSLSMTKTMLKIAIPTTIQQCIIFLGMLLVQSVVNGFGETILAGYTAGSRFESVFVIPFVALGNAYSTYTAQNIGAGNHERVKQGYKASSFIALAMSVLILLILQIFGKLLLTAFMGSEYTPLAFDTGLQYIHFLSFFFIIMGMKSITDGVLRGAGDVMVSTVANFVNLGIRILLAVSLSKTLGISAVWMALPIGWLANLMISFIRYRSGVWESIQITGSKSAKA